MNNVLKTKKGFMFTLVTIFLISIFVFVLYASTSNVMLEQQHASAERTEALVVNLFTQSLTDDYLNSMVTVAAANSIRAMVAYVNYTKTALEDPEGFYREIMMNGTIASTYAGSVLSKDVAMTLIAANGSDEIVLADIAPGSTTAEFGNYVTIVQRVSLPDAYTSLEHLKSVMLYISNTPSATSGDLYLVVYNATRDVVGIDIQQYENDVDDYTFTFGRTLPLSQDTYYDLMLAAPFTDSDSDYEIYLVPNAAFECASVSCGAAKWELTGTGTDIDALIDFFLDKKYVGEGFLRALTASFSMLGKEHFAIETEINVTNITIDESGPWEIDVNASFVLSTHKVTVTFSDLTAFGASEVSIIGLYDPYSILRTDLLSDDGRYFQITSQNVSDDFSEDDMARHISEHTFVFNEDAPSFMERFKGEDAEGSNYSGIQAVYQDDDIIGDGSVPDKDRGYSYVDYKFQESTQCNVDLTDPLYYPFTSGDLHKVMDGQTPWFDYASIEFYHMDEMGGVNVATAICPTE